MAEGAPNPVGFSDRLRLLMEGWGYSTRELADKSGVSHGTIANWLNGKGRATLEDVERVARVFAWSRVELYDGVPAPHVMTRVAELEGFRAMVLRMADEIASRRPVAHHHRAPIEAEREHLRAQSGSVPSRAASGAGRGGKSARG